MIDARDVADLLGGKPVLGISVRSFSDLASAIKAGLPGAVMRALIAKSGSSAKEVSETVRIPARTLARLQQRKRLPADAGDKLYRLAFVIALATKALGDRETAHKWLRRENRALGGITPLEAIGTEPGLHQVERELGRIEYGDLS